jgi:hypothetical protein
MLHRPGKVALSEHSKQTRSRDNLVRSAVLFRLLSCVRFFGLFRISTPHVGTRFRNDLAKGVHCVNTTVVNDVDRKLPDQMLPSFVTGAGLRLLSCKCQSKYRVPLMKRSEGGISTARNRDALRCIPHE